MIVSFILTLIINLFPLQEELRPYIEELCTDYQIQEELVEAMIYYESTWNPEADNGGCKGLMQISEYWHRDRMEKLGVTDLHDARGNINVGVDYLRELFDRYEDVGLVLDIYNGNANAWKNYENGTPSVYATNILNMAEELEEQKKMDRNQFLHSLEWANVRGGRSKSDKDVSITIGNYKDDAKRLSFTFRNGVANLISDTGYFKFASYKNRLILVSADAYTGLVLTTNKEVNVDTRYAKVAVQNIVSKYRGFVGNYDLKYDAFYDYYYIEKEVNE